MRKPKASAVVEWCGGLASLSSYVTGEGAPYRPELLIWLSPGGLVLGTQLGRPGELLPLAAESLRATIASPMVAGARPPTRVRVATRALADALGAGHPRLEVRCAPTPEVDEVVASMQANFDELDGEEASWLALEASPEAVARLFRSSARLYRAAPWSVLPADAELFVTSAQLGLHDAVLSVIGQMGESLGWALFENGDDFERFLDGSEALQRGEEVDMPRYVALTFEPGSELSDEMRREIAQHRWEVAGPRAYPWLVSVDEQLTPLPPTPEEVHRAEALCQALAAFLEAGPTEPRTVRVETHEGQVEVSFSAPAVDEVEGADREQVDALQAELLRRFLASPEATGLAEAAFIQVLMDYAVAQFGQMLSDLSPPELEQLVFGIVPRQVSVDASAAASIVAVTRAFFLFMGREFSLRRVDARLHPLGEGAVQRLETALSDPHNFGLAKTLVMAGKDAGYDMSSKAGIEAWARTMQGAPLPVAVRPPPGRAGAKEKGARRTRPKHRR
jgi:hypothetical protein